jgi:hypothetical protein
MQANTWQRRSKRGGFVFLSLHRGMVKWEAQKRQKLEPLATREIVVSIEEACAAPVL